MTGYIVIYCTIASKDDAAKIASSLVEKKLIACASIVGEITSIYKWKGKICADPEYLMIIKSKKHLFNEIKDEIKKLHPYEVPEIISIPITDGIQSYLSWIDENTRSASQNFVDPA